MKPSDEEKPPIPLDYVSPGGVKPSGLPAWVIIFIAVLSYMVFIGIVIIGKIIGEGLE